MLQCDAVCCIVLQCTPMCTACVRYVCYSVLPCFTVCCSVLQYVVRVLQCAALCCSTYVYIYAHICWNSNVFL